MESGNKEHEDQESNHDVRHYCKVCNKGFGCAGALGGHMRTHVMGGDNACNNNNNSNNNVVDEHNKPEGNKHSYFLRAKVPRYVAGHNDHQENGHEYKKTSLPPSSSVIRFGTEKERLMSSSSSMSPPLPPSSGSRPHESMNLTSREEEDLANCLVMLSNKSCHSNNGSKEENKGKEVVERGLFQCKACKKVFTSHQALGGHRASHKKVKGCFAAKVDNHGINDIDDNADEDSSILEENDRETPDADTTRPVTVSTRKRPHKMHECSVCRRVFSSGQALGGHKRCHWLTTSTDNSFIPNFNDFQYNHQNQLQQHQQQQQQFYKKLMMSTAKPAQHDSCDDNQIDLNLNLHGPQLDNASKCDVSTTLYLQQLAANTGKIESKHNERVCEPKLRKLSDLRDVNLDGGWLQMGIASTTDLC